MPFQLDPKEECRAIREGQREAEREVRRGQKISNWESGDPPRKKLPVLNKFSEVISATPSNES